MSGALSKARHAERKAMIDREHELPLTRQAADRGAASRSPVDYPFAGSRMLRDLLRGEGIEIDHQRVATIMKRISGVLNGIEKKERPSNWVIRI